MVGFDVTHASQIEPSSLDRALIDYRRQHNWEIAATTIATPAFLTILPEVGCNGAIVRLTSEAMRDAARSTPFPTVNFSAWLEDPGVPTVRRDDRAMGKLAAEHLLAKGFRRFGIISCYGGWYIQARTAGITETLDLANAEYSIFHPLPESPTPDDITRLAEQLKKLPRPAGLIVTEGLYAETLYTAIEYAGFKIPLDFAVVGINPAQGSSEPLSPSFSYIHANEYICGLHAAELLDQLMEGQTASQQMTYIPPKGLIAGESSDITCYKDRIVARTVDMVRRQAHLPINVTNIADTLGVSPYTLTRHCREHLGMGPYQYLCNVRINRAASLLKQNPKMPLVEIAHAVGLPGRKRLNMVFHRLKGISPAEFRRSQAPI